MTEQQMRWAEQFDWCVGRVGNEAVVTREHMNDAANTVEHRTWTDFEEMREWAGF